MRSWRKLLLILLLIGVGVAVGRELLTGAPSRSEPEPRAASAPTRAPPSAPRFQPSAAPSFRPTPKPPSSKGWETFASRFGTELVPVFSADRRLLSATARPGLGAKVPGFKPRDPQAAIARAKEILDQARELIGETAGFPLGTPLAKGTEHSSQVSFLETYQGIPLAPFGEVSITLGQDGELLRLESSYIPSPEVLNSPSLDLERARARALEAAPVDTDTPAKAEGGRPVIWVSRAAEQGAPQGRFAYEFNVQGRQIIVDASTGAVLFQKNQRHY